MAEKKESVMYGNTYPIFKATTTPQKLTLIGSGYIIYSAIQGFVPAVDVMFPNDGGLRTMIINQMSVGKALFQKWRDKEEDLHGIELMISRVAEGRMAPYKIEVL